MSLGVCYWRVSQLVDSQKRAAVNSRKEIFLEKIKYISWNFANCLHASFPSLQLWRVCCDATEMDRASSIPDEPLNYSVRRSHTLFLVQTDAIRQFSFWDWKGVKDKTNARRAKFFNNILRITYLYSENCWNLESPAALLAWELKTVESLATNFVNNKERSSKSAVRKWWSPYSIVRDSLVYFLLAYFSF